MKPAKARLLAPMALLVGGCATSDGPALTAASDPAGTGSAPVAPNDAASVSARPAGAGEDDIVTAIYAPLFELGRTFDFAVATERSFYDPSDAKADKHGYVNETGSAAITCAVASVGTVTGGRLATIDCGAKGNESFVLPLPGATPAGHYIATSKGLHRVALAEDPNDESLRVFLLARIPEPASNVRKTPDGETRRVVKQRADGAWCAEETHVFADGGFDATCFAAGKGMVFAERTFSGGSTHTAKWTLTRSTPPKTK